MLMKLNTTSNYDLVLHLLQGIITKNVPTGKMIRPEQVQNTSSGYFLNYMVSFFSKCFSRPEKTLLSSFAYG